MPRGLVALLVAGGAPEACSQFPSVSPRRSKEPTPLLSVCCSCVLAEMGATSTASGQLEVNLFCLRFGAERALLPCFTRSGNLKIEVKNKSGQEVWLRKYAFLFTSLFCTLQGH
jgi:hypothetical protein